jgi:hypothetical protein
MNLKESLLFIIDAVQSFHEKCEPKSCHECGSDIGSHYENSGIDDECEAYEVIISLCNREVKLIVTPESEEYEPMIIDTYREKKGKIKKEVQHERTDN